MYLSSYTSICLRVYLFIRVNPIRPQLPAFSLKDSVPHVAGHSRTKGRMYSLVTEGSPG